MKKSLVANCKLAGSLLALLGIFGANAQGWREIVSLTSTRADLGRELRASGFRKVENTLAFNRSTSYEGVVAEVDDLPSMSRCQNIVTAWNTTKTQGNSWRGLTPLQSMREEVERLLGSPKDSVGKIFIYDTQAEKVHVWYSEGACKTSGIGQWNVPLGTVLQIRVYPKATILLRDLQFDMSKYQRLPDPNIPNWALYQNEDSGVLVQTKLENGCEQVEILTYEPTKKDSQLRCSTAWRKNQ